MKCKNIKYIRNLNMIVFCKHLAPFDNKSFEIKTFLSLIPNLIVSSIILTKAKPLLIFKVKKLTTFYFMDK